MTKSVLKDIRLYESATENISGQSLPSELGVILKPTENSNFIATRIARKLNELQYVYGEQDHIYINFTTFLKENEIMISKRDVDKKIAYIDFGISEAKFNALADADKDVFIEKTVLEILKAICNKDNQKFIEQTELELSNYGRKLKIHFKTKETKSYRVDIYYQIAPINKFSNGIIEYLDKKSERIVTKEFQLKLYSDIYALTDKIVVKSDKITLLPKKSNSTQFVIHDYKTPLEFELI